MSAAGLREQALLSVVAPAAASRPACLVAYPTGSSIPTRNALCTPNGAPDIWLPLMWLPLMWLPLAQGARGKHLSRHKRETSHTIQPFVIVRVGCVDQHHAAAFYRGAHILFTLHPSGPSSSRPACQHFVGKNQRDDNLVIHDRDLTPPRTTISSQKGHARAGAPSTVVRAISLRIINALVPILQDGFHEHLQLLQQHFVPLPAMTPPPVVSGNPHGT